jgi:hypothetical protein
VLSILRKTPFPKKSSLSSVVVVIGVLFGQVGKSFNFAIIHHEFRSLGTGRCNPVARGHEKASRFKDSAVDHSQLRLQLCCYSSSAGIMSVGFTLHVDRTNLLGVHIIGNASRKHCSIEANILEDDFCRG